MEALEWLNVEHVSFPVVIFLLFTFKFSVFEVPWISYDILFRAA